MTKQITEAEYTALFDNDLTEVSELYLRHAGKYVDTIAFSNDDENFYLSCVSNVTSKEVCRIACCGLDDHYENVAFYRHETMAEVHAFYAQMWTKYQTDEIHV